VPVGNPGADAQARAYLKSAEVDLTRNVSDRYPEFVVIDSRSSLFRRVE
jgi:hypothetical protein